MCWGLDALGCPGQGRISRGFRLWWGDGWLMGPFNHRSQPLRDGDLSQRQPHRHYRGNGVAAQASTAEEEFSPLMTVCVAGKPYGPFPIPHQPSEGKRGAAG